MNLPKLYISRRPASMKTFQLWLKGLAAALVSGAANGVVSAFSLMGIDAEHFNVNAGLHNVLTAAGTIALVSGILGAAMYLKQSPVPPDPK